MDSHEDLRQAKALFNTGLALFGNADYTGALDCWRSALNYTPNRASILKNIALALVKLERPNEAISVAQRLLSIDPTDAEIWKLLTGLKVVYEQVPSNQEIQLNIPLHAKRDNFQLMYSEVLKRADLALEKNNFKSAITLFNRALTLSPNSVASVIGKMQAIAGKSGALKALQFAESIKEKMKNSTKFWSEYGYLKEKTGEYSSALADYEEGLRLNRSDKNLRFRKSLILLRQGKYAEGWNYYESRFGDHLIPARHTSIPRLLDLKDAIGKKLLVWSEQGLGDTFQFVRYLLPLENKGIAASLECPKELLNVLGHSLKISVFQSLDHRSEFAFQVPLISLAAMLWNEYGHLESKVPYIFPKNDGRNPNIEVIRNIPTIGLVCSGNPNHKNDINRSISLKHFVALSKEVNLFIVQKTVRDTDQLILNSNKQIVDCSPFLNDFSDTVALINRLDVLVSVDTSVAHLAGAMGKPVILILPQDSDWRWGINSTETKWYPKTKLLRMKTGQNMHDIVGAIKTKLVTENAK